MHPGPEAFSIVLSDSRNLHCLIFLARKLFTAISPAWDDSTVPSPVEAKHSRPIRWMTLPSITCSTEDGYGCCNLTMGLPAPASLPPISLPPAGGLAMGQKRGTESSAKFPHCKINSREQKQSDPSCTYPVLLFVAPPPPVRGGLCCRRQRDLLTPC